MILRSLVLRSIVQRSLIFRFSSTDAVETVLPTSSNTAVEISKEKKEIKKLVIPGLSVVQSNPIEIYQQKVNLFGFFYLSFSDWL